MQATEAVMPSHSSNSIANQVAGVLRACGYSSLTKLHVTSNSRAVILYGTVPSYYLKQQAQTLAMTVNGVSRVINHTVVSR